MDKNTAFLETLVKEAYKKITALEAQLARAQQPAPPTPPEPIAVIGMGCRFPGADRPEAYWELLIEGRSAICDVPSTRWDLERYAALALPTVKRTAWCRGGFLDQVDQFDPLFFRISPLEAMTMDPQQRLLLEVTWEALEHAALAPDGLEGSKTGVFIGMTAGQSLADLAIIRSEKAMYAGTGQTPSIAAGRISYIFGFQGPCFALDTACSSSMMAVHEAVGSLRAGECDLAVAGGVNVLTPEANVLMANAGWLAADGHSKTFDAAADGHARSEGCGIVVLKRLTDALRDGDKIWAVIRGSASNHDGRTSGLTVPNGPMQQALIRHALENAGVRPEEVSYSEAHATGTSLGDVIEVNSLAAVYADRQEPLLIGSVKPNLGHLESASGTTSLMKLILMLYHGELAPHIGMQRPNPNISWQTLPLQVVTARRPWPTNPVTPKRIAGVSGFGFSGTNVHLILEAPPAANTDRKQTAERPLHLLALAAKEEVALKSLAERYATHLAEQTDLALADVCFTANTGRAHFAHRLSVLSNSTADLREKLAAFAAGKRKLGVVAGQAAADRPKIAFLFSGLGGQAVGMGQQLYATAPVFRKAIDRCAELLRPLLDQPLTQVLYGADPATAAQQLAQTVYAEPALFAVEYALAQLWQSWGIKPDVVLGHSLGEYVAACVAGVFPLEDALRLVAERGRLIQAASRDGATASLFTGPDRAAELIAPWANQVSLAGFNSPEETLIAGQAVAVDQVLVATQQAGLDGKRLPVAHAAHSPLMEPVLAQFTQVAQTIKYRTPRIKLISSVTGDFCNKLDTAHWRQHLREPVRFAESIAALQTTDCLCMVEIGPQPVLLWLGRQNWTGEAAVQWLASLWSLHPDWQQLLQSLAQLYVQGVAVDWRGVYPKTAYQKVVLPTYPFQRKRYWIDPPAPSVLVQPPVATANGNGASKMNTTAVALPALEASQPEVQEAKLPKGALLAQLRAAPAPDRLPLLLDFLQAQVAAVLYLEPAQVKPDANLVEFGMDSMMAMTILNACRDALGFVLYPRDLYERPVLQKFAAYLAVEFERLQGDSSQQGARTTNQEETEASLGSALLDQVAKRIYTAPAQKNPPMLFVLSAPRSGSTLFRVMLAGHPALFAPPELHLLWLERMSEFPQLNYLGEGLQRTLMAQRGLDAAASQALIDQWVAEDRSVQEVYGLLQAAAAPKLLVDKSPTYGGHLHVLQRIEQLFDQPKYIHLVRHPYAMIDSFVRNRIDRIGGYAGMDAFAIAEQAWVDANRNIRTHFANLPAERQFTLRYEDLVRDAQGQMQQLCAWLAIPFDDALLQPYQGERMTDGVHAGSIPLGDMNFARHRQLRPELAEVWRKVSLPRPLGDAAAEIATALGYPLPPPASQAGMSSQAAPSTSQAKPPRAQAELSMQTYQMDVRGLALAVCTWGPEDGPPVVCVHGLLDQGASWAAVATALAQQGYRVFAPDLRGHGCSEHVGPGRSYQFMDFIGDLDALLRQLTQEPITLVGHSLGATIAAFYAAARPTQIARLVLVEPYIPTARRQIDLVEQITTRLDYLALDLQHTVLPDVQNAVEQLRQAAPLMPVTLAQTLAERLTKPADENQPGVIWRWDPRLKVRMLDLTLQDELGQAAYLALLQRLSMPLTVVYGQWSDRQQPEERRLLAAQLPQLQTLELAGGHNVQLEAPVELAQIIAPVGERQPVLP